MRKKALIIFFLFFSVSFLMPQGVFLDFSSSVVFSSDDNFEAVYGNRSYAFSGIVGFSLIEGIYPGVKYRRRSTKGNTTFTKEEIELNMYSIGLSLKFYPLDTFLKEYIFFVSPYISAEYSFFSFKEEIPDDLEYSDKKGFFFLSFGIGITVDENKKINIEVSKRSLKFLSEDEEIDLGGIEVSVGFIFRF